MAASNSLREEVRNRLLRRADWRFFLPTPKPAKSMCFANGLLGRAVKLISDRMADDQLDPAGDCDLAVAVNPNRATLQQGWIALRPGGSCYTEWYSPLAGGPRGIRRRLEAAGFEDVTCYWAWPWPSLSHPRYWLPLGAPGALQHFLLSRPPSLGAVRRIANAGLRALWLSGLRLGLTLPICAVAHKSALSANHHLSTASRLLSSDSRSSASGISQDLHYMIRDQWGTWGLGPTPDRLSSLVLTGGHRSVGKVVWLVFAEPDHSPRLAVKMPRVPESVPGLTKEATTLQSIQALRPNGVQGVPRVLFCQEHAGLLTVGETALTGQPIPRLLRPDTFREFAFQATAWLADLAGRPIPCPPAMWWNRLIEPVLADFEESFGPVVDPGMLRETKDILATLGALPLVCEQRDFGLWNVLVTADGGLAVLDWESSEPQGLPAMDLIYFLSFLALSLDGTINPGSIRANYRKTLSPSASTGGVVRECLERYASETGFDLANLRPLRLLCWLLHSRSEYQWFVADVARKPEREALRRSLFLSLWEQEVRLATRS
ncbi:MAG TPA: hypothetical protein VKK81_03890 [Candidatus Binatia bacterium]|nr:hypothetical protein [Candidatus Binatia bacterium]